jgi:hypothetical protein
MVCTSGTRGDHPRGIAERDRLDSFIWFLSFNQTNQID